MVRFRFEKVDHVPQGDDLTPADAGCEVNTCNHKELAPYAVAADGCVLVDRRWAETQFLPGSLERVEDEGNAVLVDDLEASVSSHGGRIARGPTDAFYRVYAVFNDQYDFDHWCEPLRDLLLAPDFVRVPLRGDDCDTLLEISLVRANCDSPRLLPRHRERYPETLVAQVGEAVESVLGAQKTRGEASACAGIFAKVSSTSGKNDRALRPLHDAEQVLDFMTNARGFAMHAYDRRGGRRQVSLVLAPWHAGLDRRLEFRVFVRDRKLLAVSQQEWFREMHYTREELERAARAIDDLVARVVSPDRMPFPSAVLDVLVVNGKDGGGDGEWTARLIECNPYFAWQSSGSSLFHWVRDAHVLDGRLAEEEEEEEGGVVVFRHH